MLLIMLETEVYITSQSDGVPEIVSVRPIIRGDHNEEEEDQLIYSTIATTLRSAVVNAVQSTSSDMATISYNNIDGILQMNNTSDHRHAHTADVRLNTLDSGDIQSLFERVADYGEITIYDIEFSYWINPLSLMAGMSYASYFKLIFLEYRIWSFW